MEVVFPAVYGCGCSRGTLCGSVSGVSVGHAGFLERARALPTRIQVCP